MHYLTDPFEIVIQTNFISLLGVLIIFFLLYEIMRSYVLSRATESLDDLLDDTVHYEPPIMPIEKHIPHPLDNIKNQSKDG